MEKQQKDSEGQETSEMYIRQQNLWESVAFYCLTALECQLYRSRKEVCEHFVNKINEWGSYVYVCATPHRLNSDSHGCAVWWQRRYEKF